MALFLCFLCLFTICYHVQLPSAQVMESAWLEQTEPSLYLLLVAAGISRLAWICCWVFAGWISKTFAIRKKLPPTHRPSPCWVLAMKHQSFPISLGMKRLLFAPAQLHCIPSSLFFPTTGGVGLLCPTNR